MRFLLPLIAARTRRTFPKVEFDCGKEAEKHKQFVAVKDHKLKANCAIYHKLAKYLFQHRSLQPSPPLAQKYNGHLPAFPFNNLVG